LSVVAMTKAPGVVRVCLYGPTASGKSTIARHLAKTYGGEIIKVAEPLYRLQKLFYDELELPVNGQDGELLQFFADKIEREQPGWLGRRVTDRVQASATRLVINDDCRRNSYAALDTAGFVFVRIDTSPDKRAIRRRADHRAVDPHHRVEAGFDEFRTDYEISNDGALDDTFRAAETLIDRLLSSSRERS
jgi:energy-coupling factor transporter ATP-binding protein EcfA2